jgi:threonine/homoserine/homoserine lactone efflux protein
MPSSTALIAFALVAFTMVLTPGPNMIYLVSRSITQGVKAGMVSLGGVVLGLFFYVLCAAFGITALLFAVPYAYDALRLAGAAYLLYLAWQAVKPNGRSPCCSIPRSRCSISHCCRSSSTRRREAC